jgi:hypothetical protein
VVFFVLVRMTVVARPVLLSVVLSRVVVVTLTSVLLPPLPGATAEDGDVAEAEEGDVPEEGDDDDGGVDEVDGAADGEDLLFCATERPAAVEGSPALLMRYRWYSPQPDVTASEASPLVDWRGGESRRWAERSREAR